MIGAGTVGILTLLALKELTKAGHIAVVAKHAKQREWAGAFGASEIVDPKEATNAVRRATGAMKLKPERGAPFLLGGADVAIDCVGSRSSLNLALGSRGPAAASWSPVSPPRAPTSHRSGSVSSSSWAPTPAGTRPSARHLRRRHSFEIATQLAQENPIDQIVGATYLLCRWREAIDHALGAGKLGTLKVAFDPRLD